MGFLDNFPTINTGLMTQLGDSVTYTQDGSPSSIKAVITGKSKDVGDPYAHALSSEALVLETDIAQPKYGDTITQGAKTWHVVHVIEKELGVWRLNIQDKLTSDMASGRRWS